MPKEKRAKSQKETPGASNAAGSGAGLGSGASSPTWPRFKPTLPIADLEIENIIPETVVVLRHFFPKSLCEDYVAFLSGLPLIKTSTTPKRGEALRKNSRYQVEDPVFANRLWAETGLRNAILAGEASSHLWGGEVAGLSPIIRVYRYTAGDHFDAHYDDSNNVSVLTENGESVSAKTTWTLLLYLTAASEGCAGGETSFYLHDRRSAKEEVCVAPETGMLLLHRHGDDCLLHEGKRVIEGEKWILRTDLCVRRRL